ncbi:uncharacterized protein LOC136035579 [Artemia franciscana]|uniref:Peptidase S1 domain-containing protein n=1 Tax=Artemia franciscana TaxID=6661 RepID=A0AA88I492_ARTSF|nr:hypothetical protein QYM36_003716 [Artemia franciscana]
MVHFSIFLCLFGVSTFTDSAEGMPKMRIKSLLRPQLRGNSCTARGGVGECVYVWSCWRSGGTHLGLCRDRFLIGSCCRQKNYEVTETSTSLTDASEETTTLATTNTISSTTRETTTTTAIATEPSVNSLIKNSGSLVLNEDNNADPISSNSAYNEIPAAATELSQETTILAVVTTPDSTVTGTSATTTEPSVITFIKNNGKYSSINPISSDSANSETPAAATEVSKEVITAASTTINPTTSSISVTTEQNIVKIIETHGDLNLNEISSADSIVSSSAFSDVINPAIETSIIDTDEQITDVSPLNVQLTPGTESDTTSTLNDSIQMPGNTANNTIHQSSLSNEKIVTDNIDAIIGLDSLTLANSSLDNSQKISLVMPFKPMDSVMHIMPIHNTSFEDEMANAALSGKHQMSQDVSQIISTVYDIQGISDDAQNISTDNFFANDDNHGATVLETVTIDSSTIGNSDTSTSILHKGTNDVTLAAENLGIQAITKNDKTSIIISPPNIETIPEAVIEDDFTLNKATETYENTQKDMIDFTEELSTTHGSPTALNLINMDSTTLANEKNNSSDLQEDGVNTIITTAGFVVERNEDIQSNFVDNLLLTNNNIGVFSFDTTNNFESTTLADDKVKSGELKEGSDTMMVSAVNFGKETNEDIQSDSADEFLVSNTHIYALDSEAITNIDSATMANDKIKSSDLKEGSDATNISAIVSGDETNEDTQSDSANEFFVINKPIFALDSVITADVESTTIANDEVKSSDLKEGSDATNITALDSGEETNEDVQSDSSNDLLVSDNYIDGLGSETTVNVESVSLANDEAKISDLLDGSNSAIISAIISDEGTNKVIQSDSNDDFLVINKDTNPFGLETTISIESTSLANSIVKSTDEMEGSDTAIDSAVDTDKGTNEESLSNSIDELLIPNKNFDVFGLETTINIESTTLANDKVESNDLKAGSDTEIISPVGSNEDGNEDILSDSVDELFVTNNDLDTLDFKTTVNVESSTLVNKEENTFEPTESDSEVKENTQINYVDGSLVDIENIPVAKLETTSSIPANDKTKSSNLQQGINNGIITVIDSDFEGVPKQGMVSSFEDLKSNDNNTNGSTLNDIQEDLDEIESDSLVENDGTNLIESETTINMEATTVFSTEEHITVSKENLPTILIEEKRSDGTSSFFPALENVAAIPEKIQNFIDDSLLSDEISILDNAEIAISKDFAPFSDEANLSTDEMLDSTTIIPHDPAKLYNDQGAENHDQSNNTESHTESNTYVGISEIGTLSVGDVPGLVETPDVLLTLKPVVSASSKPFDCDKDPVCIWEQALLNKTSSNGTIDFLDSEEVTYQPEVTRSTYPIPTLKLSTEKPKEKPILSKDDQRVILMLNMKKREDVCGRPTMTQARIVNGKKALFGQFPWQIAVYARRPLVGGDPKLKCGAVLLDHSWVITAAHCLERVRKQDIFLRLGEYDLESDTEEFSHEDRQVSEIVVHPKFKVATFENDIALLRLKHPVIYQPNIIPICLPTIDDNYIGKSGVVTGWGRLSEGGPLPNILQKVNLPILSNKECEQMYERAGSPQDIPESNFMCAGFRDGKLDACEGDSGGPMVIEEGDRSVLIGIVSWGIDCAAPNQPGAYTRVTRYRKWIQDTMATTPKTHKKKSKRRG